MGGSGFSNIWTREHSGDASSPPFSSPYLLQYRASGRNTCHEQVTVDSVIVV
jgi:hypothetical protein